MSDLFAHYRKALAEQFELAMNVFDNLERDLLEAERAEPDGVVLR